MGRLFDAVAALCGLCETVSFEGQAASLLESVLDPREEGSYAFAVTDGEPMLFDWRGLIADVVRDRRAGAAAGVVSARFHRAVTGLVVSACRRAREKWRVSAVALSGGVFQNAFLLESAPRALEKEGFQVYLNRIVPAGDGGIALGQAAAALKRGMCNVSGHTGDHCEPSWR